MGCKKVIAFNNKGQLVYTFNSKNECQQKLGISEYNLKLAIEDGRRDYQTGLFFDYELKTSDLYE